MSGPSNETEAEALERRKVEALEAIARQLAKIAVGVDFLTDDEGVVCVRTLKD